MKRVFFLGSVLALLQGTAKAQPKFVDSTKGNPRVQQPDSIDLKKHKATTVKGSVPAPTVVDDNAPTKLFSENWHKLVVDQNSYSVIGDKPWFVAFIAQRCPECKKLDPIFKEV